MHMNLPQGVGGGGSGGLPYPAVRTSSETSASSGSVGLGASDDWRQHLGGGTVRQMGPYDVSKFYDSRHKYADNAMFFSVTVQFIYLLLTAFSVLLFDFPCVLVLCSCVSGHL